MSDAADQSFLERAAKIASDGGGWVAPNPAVGAVVVREGKIVAEGHHAEFGGAHAEVEALRAAGDLARGATVYVTLEPCSTTGKTPACTAALIAAGVARVVFAVEDPNPVHRGRARERLAAAGIRVDGPVAPDLAPELLESFRRALASKRPYVIAKWAMTLDGKIATRTGESKWITSEEARRQAHVLRSHVQAIAVGVGTVHADRPRLIAHPPGPLAPVRVVFDRRLETPLDWAALKDGGPRVVVVGGIDADPARASALRAAGADVVLAEGADHADQLRFALPILRQRGIERMLVEGGGHLLGAFFDARCVDELSVFIATTVIGGAAAPSPVGGSGVASLAAKWRCSAGAFETLGTGDLWFRGSVRDGSGNEEERRESRHAAPPEDVAPDR